MSRLTVSIVLHRSPLPVLERTLTSLQRACAQAQAAGCLTEAVVVLLEADALRQALAFLHRHPEVGLVAPWGQNAVGQPSWLCKAYPGVLTLALRVAPKGLQRFGRVELANYEMRECDWSQTIFEPGLVSGCCLLLRVVLWRRRAQRLAPPRLVHPFRLALFQPSRLALAFTGAATPVTKRMASSGGLLTATSNSTTACNN